jgi:hypothetical protein
MPDISITIPTFNRAAQLVKTLDNGSTDTMEATYKTVRAFFRLTGTRFDWHVIQQRAWPARQKEHPMEKRLPASMRTREKGWKAKPATRLGGITTSTEHQPDRVTGTDIGPVGYRRGRH